MATMAMKSLALSSSSGSMASHAGHGRRVATMSSLSSFMGRGLPVAKRVQVAQRPLSNARTAGVRCGHGGFIPAEHRFLYEGIEKKGLEVIPEALQKAFGKA